ncbi:LysR family transcriptional regulator [Lysobacter enzymogenes]|uniref:LysR family transcriptional regulator n=1 Tax=Lysobacter enzymogenes TaxID=69 RepID=UPI00384A7459
MKPLDLKAVHAFVLIADLRSFTRAADAIGSTQSGVSLLLKRLEHRLDRRLIERTPRQIRLSAEGQAFLEPARALLAAHQRALDPTPAPQRRLVVGLSHQLIGTELPALLRTLRGQDPALVVELRVQTSREAIKAFDDGQFDAAIVLQPQDPRRNARRLYAEPFGWIAAPALDPRPGEPLRLATQGEPCGIRAAAVRALDAAGIAWTEIFIGQGAAVLGAAATAGLGVALLPRRVMPSGTADIGPRLGLPALPEFDVVQYVSSSDKRDRAALRTIAAALRGGVGA